MINYQIVLPLLKSSLVPEVTFCSFFEPLFHEGLEESFGAAHDSSFFFFEGRVGVDGVGVFYRQAEESSSLFLGFAGDDVFHVGKLRFDDAVFVVFYDEAFTDGTTDETVFEG